MNPLTTVKWPLIIGFALAVLIAVLVGGGLHFNAVTLAKPDALAAHRIRRVLDRPAVLLQCRADARPGRCGRGQGRPGRSRRQQIVAPRALLWFRWSALGTWLLGAYLLSQTPGRFINAFTSACWRLPRPMPTSSWASGAWFGTIMLFNVWGLIWPNQKKILGIVPATDEQKAAARKVALYASRTQLPAVHSHADVHGRAFTRIAVLSPRARREPALATTGADSR